MCGTIVSASELQDLLASAAKVRVLDISLDKEKDLYPDFLKCHIPGAIHFNVLRDVECSPDFPWNIPTAAVFQRQARDVGVDKDTHVVVYDNLGGGGFSIASRAWWLFRLFGHDNVSVLDGGLPAWIDAGYPTATGVEAVKEGNFSAAYRSSLIRHYDDMEKNLTARAMQVVDTRGASLYNGKKEDKKSGHYPGAKNIPLATQLVDQQHKRLKSREELMKVFSEAGIDLQQPITTSCNSGRSACAGALAAAICGNDTVAVYLGSFTEWKNRSSPENIEQS